LESKLQDTRYEGIDHRLHEMNAMRKQIEDERGSFVTRGVYDLSQQRVRDEITGLRTSRDTSAGEKVCWSSSGRCCWPWRCLLSGIFGSDKERLV
jgi:hypothetical protein